MGQLIFILNKKMRANHLRFKLFNLQFAYNLFYYFMNLYFDMNPQSDDQNSLQRLVQGKNDEIKLCQSQESLKMARRLSNLKPSKRLRRRFWKDQEQRLYLQFLEKNFYEFAKPLKEKIQSRINIKMSSHIKTKNSKQCRSHHQKMVKKWGNIEKILYNEQKLQQNEKLDAEISDLHANSIEQCRIKQQQDIYLNANFQQIQEISQSNHSEQFQS